MSKFVNTTPHTIDLENSGMFYKIPPSGLVVRVTSQPGTTTQLLQWPVPLEGPTIWGDITTTLADEGDTFKYWTHGEIGRFELDLGPWYIDTNGKREFIGLPPVLKDTVYIVSLMVANAMQAAGSNRVDVVRLGTGPNDGAIRDANNRIIAVTKFIRAV